MRRTAKTPSRANGGAVPALIAAIERQNFGRVLTFLLYYLLVKSQNPSGWGRPIAVGGTFIAIVVGIVARMKGWV